MASLLGFFQQLSLAETSAVSLDKAEEDYVLDIAAQSSFESGSKLLAATSSSHTVRLFSRNNLANIGTIKGHTDVITGICWGKSDPNILYSCSSDKTVRCWDIRCKPCKEVQKFEGSEETNDLYLSIDISCDDRVLCAGQEADKDNNVYMLFWDTRANDLLGAYSESHQDDITQVRFHPTKTDSLASGSTDGLVCLFDITEENEDDALQYTLNSCATVARLGWTGVDGCNVCCTTHMDTFHIWDAAEGDPVAEWTDLKDKLQGADSIEYIVDVLPCAGNETYVLAGNHNGDVKILDLTEKDSPKVTCTLKGGHKATVRCLHWDEKSSTLITGAEDSMLCLWSADQSASQQAVSSKPNKVKMKGKKSVSDRSHPY